MTTFSRTAAGRAHEAEALRRPAYDRLAAFLGTATAALTDGVPMAEQLSWSVKEEASKRHQMMIATNDDTELLATEANITGETIDQLSARILAIAATSRRAVAALTGLRRRAEGEIAQAMTAADADAAVTRASDDWAALNAAPQ